MNVNTLFPLSKYLAETRCPWTLKISSFASNPFGLSISIHADELKGLGKYLKVALSFVHRDFDGATNVMVSMPPKPA